MHFGTFPNEKSMKRFLALASLFAIPLLATAESARNISVQELVKTIVGGCVGRGLQRGDKPEYVYSFCNCMGEVISQNLTVAEIIEMDSAKNGMGELPQLKRILTKLQECKNDERK